MSATSTGTAFTTGALERIGHSASARQRCSPRSTDGSTVASRWIAGTNGGGQCTTDSSGNCTINKLDLKNNAASITFTVTVITDASGASVGDLDNSHDGAPENQVTINKP